MSIRHLRISKNFGNWTRHGKIITPLNIGAMVMKDVLCDFFGALAIPNNSAIECPQSILLTGLESFSIAQKDSEK